LNSFSSSIKFKYNGIDNFLIYLCAILALQIPIVLVFGPAIPDFCLSLSALLFLIVVIRNRLYSYINNSFFKILILLNIYFIISSIGSDNYLFSFQSSLFYFRFTIFSLTIYFLILNFKNFTKILFYILILFFILLFFDSLFQYFYGYNIFGYQYDGKRLSSFFNDEKILGSYIVRITPIIISLLFIVIKKKNLINIIFLFLLIFSDIVVILSAERTAIFLKVISNTLFIILLRDILKVKFFYILIMLVISASILYFDKNIYERTLKNTFENLYDKKVENKILLFSLQHELHYESAFKMFKDNPIIGIGPKMFRIKCSDKKYYTKERINNENFKYLEGCSTHPHNNYIQLLSETGLIGFIFVVFILFLLIRSFKKNISFKISKSIKDHNITVCLLISVIITIWPFVQTGNFFNNWLNVIYYYPIGLIIYYNKLI
tara:strand:+ start:109 stop:1410 length:1302 start_codon:yes stop_codon:yes gene_type:complete